MNEYMQATWDRFGGDEHERLAAELAASDEEWAALDAKYGPGASYDARRKAHRSAVALTLRAEWAAEWGKMTEAAVEERAAAHPDVVAWIDRTDLERARYAVLSAEREAIKERQRYLRGIVYAAGAEARLA